MVKSWTDIKMYCATRLTAGWALPRRDIHISECQASRKPYETGGHADVDSMVISSESAMEPRDDVCADQSRIRGWRCGGVVLESHSGLPTTLPKHAHDAYQIGITTRDPGEYLCEGKTWQAPPGSIILFHPGDVHSAVKVGVRSRADTSLLMFVVPGQLAAIAAGIDGRGHRPPVFDNLVIQDRGFIRHFADVHAFSASGADEMEKETRMILLLTELIARFGSEPIEPVPLARNRTKALLVRDYVEAHYCENISMAELAEVANTSPFHLNRLFAREIGMPPHAYRTQLRIERAKWLLLKGTPVTDVALSTGFFDQSHFTRHFKRIVGVSPRSYTLNS